MEKLSLNRRNSFLDNSALYFFLCFWDINIYSAHVHLLTIIFIFIFCYIYLLLHKNYANIYWLKTIITCFSQDSIIDSGQMEWNSGAVSDPQFLGWPEHRQGRTNKATMATLSLFIVSGFPGYFYVFHVFSLPWWFQGSQTSYIIAQGSINKYS